MAFELVQILYWLALSTWFGAVLFIAVAAPVIFKTVQEADPTLPTVLSVNLHGDHATLLAGTIVGNLLGRLLWLQLACIGGLLVALFGQLFFVNLDRGLLTMVLRCCLFVGAIGLLLYGWRSVWQRAVTQRQLYIDNADDPELANPAKEQFDRAYREGVTIVFLLLSLLSALIVFGAGVQPRSSGNGTIITVTR